MAAAEQPASTAKTDESAESSHGIHKLLSLIRCPRLYAYRYVLKLRLQFDQERLALGTAVHAGLEAHYDGKDWRQAMKKLSEKPDFAFVSDRAMKILANYFQKYKAEKLNVISVEREYGITIEGSLFTRRLDMVYEKDGALYVVDHKTAADPKKRTSQCEMDPTLISQELVGRVACTRIHGLKYGGAVLNLIPTGSGGVYSRYPLRFSARMVADMPRSLGRWLRGERNLLASGMSPWEYSQNWTCYDRYGVCDYWRLCAQGPDALAEFTVK
jgi:ATP-dependent exoDNAse (exonuclease V) beta subunit